MTPQREYPFYYRTVNLKISFMLDNNQWEVNYRKEVVSKLVGKEIDETTFWALAKIFGPGSYNHQVSYE